MKINTALYALSYYIGTFIFMPFLFIYLNQYIPLPIFKNFLLQLLGVLLCLSGFIYSIYSYKLFYHLAQGTPVPLEPSKKLIIKGLYKYTRNPIYLFHFSVIFGEMLLFGYSILFVYFLLFVAYMHVYTLAEEKGLEKRFGKEYLSYKQRVPRYIPKFK